MFFFNDTATTEIYTLSLHDALPICQPGLPAVLPDHRHRRLRLPGVHRLLRGLPGGHLDGLPPPPGPHVGGVSGDRKSTRLNSSHANISYAVFCLKKKTSTRTMIKMM